MARTTGGKLFYHRTKNNNDVENLSRVGARCCCRQWSLNSLVFVKDRNRLGLDYTDLANIRLERIIFLSRFTKET